MNFPFPCAAIPPLETPLARLPHTAIEPLWPVTHFWRKVEYEYQGQKTNHNFQFEGRRRKPLEYQA